MICPLHNNAVLNFSFIAEHSSVKVDEKAKCLGVLIDLQLNFQQHLSQVESKISIVAGIIFYLKFVQPQEALFKLYYASVQYQY